MTRDECPHGSLRRSCSVCDRDEQIAELTAARNEARARANYYASYTSQSCSRCEVCGQPRTSRQCLTCDLDAARAEIKRLKALAETHESPHADPASG